MKAFQIAILIAAAVLAGCASKGGPDTPCAKIDREIGNNAKAISGVAISRGNVDALSVPFWVPGGTKAVSVITNRRTAKLEKLQAEQTAAIAERDRLCPRAK